MTSKEFVIWLKGFSKAANSYNITPAQWDEILDELAKVDDEPKSIGVPVGPGFGVPNITPFINPIPTDPYNPYKITCQPDLNGTTIHTTPNTTGFITTTGTNTDFKFTATNGQSGSL